MNEFDDTIDFDDDKDPLLVTVKWDWYPPEEGHEGYYDIEIIHNDRNIYYWIPSVERTRIERKILQLVKDSWEGAAPDPYFNYG